MPVFAVSSKKLIFVILQSPVYCTELHQVCIAYNVAGSLPFNILKSKLRNSNLFQNASWPNKDWFANFASKLVTIAISLQVSEKEVQNDNLKTDTYHLVKKS